MRSTSLCHPRLAAILLLFSASGIVTDALAEPATLKCYTPGESDVYLRVDQDLKVVQLGRSKTDFITMPAVFHDNRVDWTHDVAKGVKWKYTFDRSTGTMMVWPLKRPDMISTSTCK